MEKEEFKSRLVAEAKTWLGTPYRNNGCLKGAGTNCAMFLFGVGVGSGVLPADTKPPDWYSPQFATHSKTERLVQNIFNYGGLEITSDQVEAGDIVVFKSGLSHGHAGLIVIWPTHIIHVMPPVGCQYSGVNDGRLAQMHKRYFSMWSEV